MSNMYMKIPGISGSATASGYEGWVQIDALHFGANRQITTRPGKVHDRVNDWPNFADVVITKQLDDATSALFKSACISKVFPEVEIAVCSASADAPQTYVQYTLSNVIISDCTHAVTHHSKPVEELHLNYTKIELSYFGTDASGQSQAPVRHGYDLETATAL